MRSEDPLLSSVFICCSASPTFSNSFNTKPGPIIYFNEDHNHNDGGGDDGPCTNSNKTHLQLAVLFA